MSLLRVESLSKSLGSWSMHAVSLTIQAGESWVILGPSGSGKSVFFKSMLGFIPVDSGAFFVKDCLVKGDEILKRFQALVGPAGIVFQASALFDTMTVFENLQIALQRLNPMPQKQAQAQILKTLHDVGLDPSFVAPLYPHQLSGGMKRRVSLARALVFDPILLFCDEPTSGLDPIASADITHLLIDLISQKKLTTVTITHDLYLIKHLGEKILMMDQGRNLWTGEREAFFQAPHPLIQRFLKATS